jgi:uncharacterized protein (TIGR03118 family)
MSVFNFVTKWLGDPGRRKGTTVRKPARARLSLEALEDRSLLSHSGLSPMMHLSSPSHRLSHVPHTAARTFQQTNLVSDQAGMAQITDPNLLNAWGISAAPSMGAFWVSATGTGLSPLYLGDVNGNALQQLFSVTIPGGSPTGQVFNINQPIMGTGNSNDFTVSDGTNRGASVFLFATTTGTIAGWHPMVGRQIPFAGGTISGQAQVGFQATDGAIYTGLAAGDVGGAHVLYAADFHNGKIDVIDGQFHKTMLAGAFTDRHLPNGYAPYNIQNLGGKLFVTYARQDRAKDGGTASGHGKGFVDVFDTSGHLLRRVASAGHLNAPWGVALAPTGFGKFGGDVLVANTGDGHIDAYDPMHHFAFRGQLSGANGKPLTIQGLKALQFGNGASSGDANALYFTAGPGNGAHGLFGSLRDGSSSLGG